MMPCDCGAIKAQTNHYHWCSVNKPIEQASIDYDAKKFPHAAEPLDTSVGWEHLWIFYDKDSKTSAKLKTVETLVKSGTDLGSAILATGGLGDLYYLFMIQAYQIKGGINKIVLVEDLIKMGNIDLREAFRFLDEVP